MALVVALAVRWGAISEKDTFTYDEPTTYLAATCHQASYWRQIDQESPPFGEIVPAGAWQRFMRSESGDVCPRKISAGLGRYDVHPPLYFWLLNVWVVLFGVGFASGPAFNVVLAVGTMLSLFGLARRIFGSAAAGVVVAFAWGVSAGSLVLSLEARHYALLLLVSLLFSWQVVRYLDAPASRRRREDALLSLAAMAGALTHYNFLLVVLALFGLMLWFVWPHARRIVLPLIAVAIGLVASFIIHPHFFWAVKRNAGTGAGLGEWRALADRTLASLGQLLVGPDIAARTSLEYYGGALVLALLAAIATVVVLAHRQRRATVSEALPLVGVAIICLVAVQYMTGGSPASAMSPKYLGAGWVFVLLGGAAIAFRLSAPIRILAATIACSALLAASSLTALTSGPWEDNTGGLRLVPAAAVEGSDLLVIDSDRWGIVARVVWHLPSDQPVLAASQDYLLADRDSWTRKVPEDTAYLGNLAFANTEDKHERLIQVIADAARGNLLVVEKDVAFGTLYRTPNNDGMRQ